MSDILYGKDNEQRIVGLHAEGDEHVRVYTRDDNDEVTSRLEKMSYLLWTDGTDISNAFTLSNVPHYLLEGNSLYNTLLIPKDRQTYYRVRKYLSEKEIRYYSINQINTQYLLQTGKTFFKGMTHDDIVRMQVDIECIAPNGTFPNAVRREDEIIIIAMSDNRGFRKILHTGSTNTDLFQACDNERKMLQEFVKWMHRRDPDVIEGHNIFGFDLPYIRDRAKRYDVFLGLGRDNSPPYTYLSTKQFAERDFEHEQFYIAGRCVIDTMFLAIDYDVYKRDLPGYGLKPIAKHFGCAANDRVYVEGSQITPYWLEGGEKRELVLKYALDDVLETDGISRHLSGAVFSLTSMVPMDYQRTHVAGRSAIIERLFVREYLRHKQSLPEKKYGKMSIGGYTDLIQQGVFTEDDNGMNYADVESLYPSIMLVYKIQPQGDYMKLFPTLLRELTDKRFESKNIMRKLKSEGKEYGAVDAKQAALKILINSFYGMLGHSGSMFNDFYEADRVTHTGQQLLRRMMEIITKKGGDIILVDTDGVLYCLPRPNMTDDEVDGFVQEVSDAMPKGINVGNDGRFDKVLAYAKKNYVLVERGSGKVKFKGVSFKGRHLEPFGKSYIRQICLALLNEDIVQVHRTHTEYVGLIVNRLLTKDDIRSRATLKKSLCEYDEGITSGNNPIVQYEIAKKFQERTGVLVHPGDVMEYYVAGTRKKSHIRSYIDGKHISQWEDDYSIVHYMSRLKKMAQKFSDFFSKEDFQIVFTMDPQKIDQGNLFFPSIDPRVKTVTIKRNRITK